MNTPLNACYEIVSFKFMPTVGSDNQRQSLQALGRWLKAQPGYLDRQSFYDSERNLWVDIVVWSEASHAKAAVIRSQGDTSLSSVFAVMDPSSIALGHYSLSN
jgi:hypothetical protein